MKISKAAKQLAKDLELSDVDAYMMELKAKLYTISADLIKASDKTHLEIAESIGTSRSRINRIANHGENNISIELLIKLITVLKGKVVFEMVS
jgi:predicted XRE-type DNA-binding protein